MASEQIDLLSLFGQATKSLKQSQSSLNQADTLNHDHGDHMVEIFDVITQAMKAKKNAEPADQLEYAAQLLRQKTSSGSTTVYANGLEQAAKQVLGKELNIGTILAIIQALMGSKQSSGGTGSSDALGSLLGQLLGGGASGKTSSGQSAGGDVLGSLLGQVLGGGGTSGGASSGQSAGGNDLGDLMGSLMGGSGNTGSGSSSGSGSDQGFGLDDLLGAGMGYMSAKQSGKSDLEAITGALLNGSTMAQTPHRAQSGEVVTNALLGALSKMMKK